MAVKLVVLASGRGSNFEAIARAVKRDEIPGARLEALICNRADAGALRIAEREGVPTRLIESKNYRREGKLDRPAFEIALGKTLVDLAPDLICLAGYTLLLGKELLARWEGRIINIHPSLLPAFKGLYAQRQALEYGVKVTGCTLHYVTEELDAGPIIAQESLAIREGEDEESLTARLLEVEHRLYVRGLVTLSHRMNKVENSDQ